MRSVNNSYIASIEKSFKVPDVKDSDRILKNNTTADTTVKYDSSRAHNYSEQKGILNFP